VDLGFLQKFTEILKETSGFPFAQNSLKILEISGSTGCNRAKQET
jgi:hypothetical protein